jgi:DNA-binding IclR family transcriptional regulator
MVVAAREKWRIESAMKSNANRRASASNAGLSRSVKRVLETLDMMLAEARPVTIPELVKGLGLSRTTTYEMMRTLRRYHYVEQVAETGHYRLGRRLYELGMAYRNQVDLLREAGDAAHELCRRTGETVQISILDNDAIMVVARSQGNHAISFVTQVGSRVPVNWGASGRLLVSDLSDQELHRRLPDMLRPSPTGKAPMEIDVLIREIREARARGYAVQLGQAVQHSGGIAAPIIDGSGRCVATISLVAPLHRLRRRHLAILIDEVKDAAGLLSRRLGGA